MQNPTGKRKISFSGIQATGNVHLGNFLGAIKNWVAFQEEYDCIYSIVDMHALTIRQDPKALRDNTLRAYALMAACGVDADRSILFIQSHVPAHAELAWALNCYTPFGELGRMTQFKDKSRKNEDNINVGLFGYPVLQASDILLYQTDVVPIGEDQKQHLELSRNIAMRFNGIYGDVFKIPEPIIPKTGGRIMSLGDPAKKMSKSDPNPKATIALLDPKDTIIKKFKSAVTDSEAEIVYRNGKDGINNLLTIYSLVTGKDIPAVEAEFAGRGYGDFKLAVGEAAAELLAPIQQRFAELYGDKAQLEVMYRESAERAAAISAKTLGKVYKKIGYVV